MSISMVLTKLYIPPPRPRVMLRSRLIARLNLGLECKLLLISAPAGYGKTTLLSTWLAQNPCAAAWVSLDEGDNDCLGFLTYLATAIQQIYPPVGQALLTMLREVPLSSPQILGAQWVNQLMACPAPFLLVLDDYHRIQSVMVQQFVGFVLEHLPDCLHLVIVTRADPPLPLSRLRARAQMIELRLADLRFSLSESAEFLRQVMGLELSDGEVAVLDASTEGWIASLQLAAISMSGRSDPASFVRSFHGTHRFVLDYLIDEVFSGLPDSIQKFLLQTSILERFTAALCTAVTGVEDSLSVLNWLEQANLFLLPLDEERRWYRYHNLFKDLLLKRLEQSCPDQMIDLHRRAAAWYEQEGLIAEAVNHAIVGSDYQRLLRLVESGAYAMGDYDLTRLARQLEALPAEVTRAQPWIFIAQAWALLHTGHMQAVEPILCRAEQVTVGLAAHSASEALRLLGHITTIRQYHSGLQGNFPQAIELARQALQLLPQEEAATRSFSATVQGCMLRWTGRLAEASQAAAQAVVMGRISGNSNVLVNALGDQAMLLIIQGRLSQAAATCREALDIAGQSVRFNGRQVPAAGQACVFLSTILYERNEVEAALQYAREGLQLNQGWGQANDIFRAYLCLARVLQVAGESDGAVQVIQDAERLAGRLSEWFVRRAAVMKAWLQLVNGDEAAALHWAETSGLNFDDAFGFEQYEAYSLLAQVLLLRGELEQAGQLLARLLKMVVTAGAMSYVIEILTLQAMAAFTDPPGKPEQKRSASALRILERALALAEPEGFVRTFLDRGAALEGRLRQVWTAPLRPGYVNRLLAAFETGREGRRLPLQPGAAVQNIPLVEPLSGRELEVLQFLGRGSSDKEIAEALFIARETVHKHLKHIYAKLGVHSRTAAAARGRELGIL